MENNKSVYELSLHESAIIASNGVKWTVLRVPGGWIYFHCEFNVSIQQFVPFVSHEQAMAELT